MRLAVMLVCVMAALVAAGGTAPAQDKAPESQSGGKAGEHKLTEAKSYLSLEPIYTTIVDDQHAAGMLMVGLGLDVPEPGLREQASRALPLLRDAYIRNLLAFTATSVRTTSQPDVVAIAARLQGVTDRALGHKGARVLLAQVALRVTH